MVIHHRVISRLVISHRHIVWQGWEAASRARARRPRAAPRDPDARLRAAQAAHHAARHVPGVLLRLALPDAAQAAEAGWITEERPECGHRTQPRVPGAASGSTGSPPRARSTSPTCSPRRPGRLRRRGLRRRLAFFAQTRSDIRLRILEGRRRRVEEQREGIGQTRWPAPGERLDRYTLELQQHGLESVDREVRWLNELIDNERVTGADTRTSADDPRRPDTASIT